MSEWVSVDGGYPTKLESVLCRCNDIVNGWYEVLFFDGFEWNDTNGDAFPCLVTHWMPLPEPPNETTN